MKNLPKINPSKALKVSLPYLIAGLLCTKLGEAYRLTTGGDVIDRLLAAFTKLGLVFQNPFPSLHPFDLLVGAAAAVLLRLVVWSKIKNAKKYRHGEEYGTARWGNEKDIAPFINSDFSQNILLTDTERLTLGKIADPEKRNVNLNVLVIGGSGSGKTRYHIKPNLLQMNASYVCSDPKGTVVEEVGRALVQQGHYMLEYTQKGTAKATVGNYMVVLRNDPLVRESMKYNKLTGRIDIVKKLWWNEEICKLDDDGRTYFYYFFERYYKLTSEKCMDKALRIEANSRAYHPICEYLEQLEWDGQERIRYVLQRYMGADASDFVYEVVKHFLMEALSRIYRPGCKADEMLCLVGQQGAGKSTFFRFLALNDDWFSDDLKQLNDSKIYEHLRGHWIMEMSEMIAAISAKSNEEIKSFLTRQKDTYRNPYDKYEEDRKRQCIFAGSTNTRQFIPFDRTGARRFLPIAIDSSKAEKHILDDDVDV